MGERKKRQVFSPEFKAKVGLEAIRGLKTVNELGQEYGVHPVQISQWKKAILEQSEKLFEGKRGPKPVSEHQEPDRLYSEIGRLKMELDWRVSRTQAQACDAVLKMEEDLPKSACRSWFQTVQCCCA